MSHRQSYEDFRMNHQRSETDGWRAVRPELETDDSACVVEVAALRRDRSELTVEDIQQASAHGVRLEG